MLAGLIAVACAPRRAITAGSPLPEALRLGWRLVPGQVLVYDTLTVHRQPGQVSRLRARWRYQVVAREQGIATLSGHLVGIGGQVKGEGDTITRLNAESPAPERTRLRLGTDGRIRPDAGADCGVVGMPSAAVHSAQNVGQSRR